MERDEFSDLSDQEYRDGLKMAALAQHSGWITFLVFCNDYVNEKKEAVFNKSGDELATNLERGRGQGVGELLSLFDTRINLALAQQEREAEANSAEKEKQ